MDGATPDATGRDSRPWSDPDADPAGDIRAAIDKARGVPETAPAVPAPDATAADSQEVWPSRWAHPTWWNGQPAVVRRVVVLVADSKAMPHYWARQHVGTERPAVEVTYGDQVFYLDDEDDRGWRKVTEGRGSPSYGHRSLSVEAVLYVRTDVPPVPRALGGRPDRQTRRQAGLRGHTGSEQRGRVPMSVLRRMEWTCPSCGGTIKARKEHRCQRTKR